MPWLVWLSRLSAPMGTKESPVQFPVSVHVWLPLVGPLVGTWPTTQACALTGN